ncbi:colicin V production family protein [Candidatus Endolissoclinum faulkneri L5]|uniref:Colicin V production family protein n=1 Tax=Candidatus Endolissoclinum faulkneri L5 TaxID=1401328 RepID=V9TT93_9PROT|nr:colicin V production family protein [Candidatus Endolissoclinum faulkneri L5]
MPALIRGFIYEISYVFAWISALLVLIYAYNLITVYLANFIAIDASLEILIAGSIFFLLFLIVFINLGKSANTMMPMIKFNLVNRILGFIFGIVRGLVIIYLIYSLVSWIEPNSENYPTFLKEAQLLPIIVAGSDRLNALVPQSLKTKLVEKQNI